MFITTTAFPTATGVTPNPLETFSSATPTPFNPGYQEDVSLKSSATIYLEKFEQELRDYRERINVEIDKKQSADSDKHPLEKRANSFIDWEKVHAVSSDNL